MMRPLRIKMNQTRLRSRKKSTESTVGGMSLNREPQKEYNDKNYNDSVFDITYETHDNRIILMQLNSDNSEIT